MASSRQQKQNEGVRIGIPYSVLCRGYIQYTPPHWLEDDSFPAILSTKSSIFWTETPNHGKTDLLLPALSLPSVPLVFAGRKTLEKHPKRQRYDTVQSVLLLTWQHENDVAIGLLQNIAKCQRSYLLLHDITPTWMTIHIVWWSSRYPVSLEQKPLTLDPKEVQNMTWENGCQFVWWKLRNILKRLRY